MASRDIDTAFGAALAKHEAGDMEGAAAGYRQVLAKAPRHVDALNLLGVVALQTGRPDQALAPLKKVVSLDPGFATARVNLGHALTATGDRTGALVQYRAAQRAQPNDPDVRHALGTALIDAGDHAGAREHLLAALSQDPAHVGSLVNLATLAERQGDASQALHYAQRAVAVAPDDVTALATLSGQYLVAGDVKRALTCADRALQQAPDNRQGLGAKALALSAMSRTGEALSIQARLVEAFPEDPVEWTQLGQIKLTGRDFGGAVTAFEAALTLAPGDMTAALGRAEALVAEAPERVVPELEALSNRVGEVVHLLRVAEIWQRSGQAERAEATLRRVVAADPMNVAPKIALAHFLVKEARPKDALTVLTDCDITVAVLLARAEAWFAARDREAAAECLAQAEALATETSLDQFHIAKQWQRLGRLERALAVMERMVAKDPLNAHTRNLFALCLLEGGLPERALAEARTAVAFAAGDPDALVTVGVALQALGRNGEAETTFQDALRLNPHNSLIYINLGNCLLGMHRVQEAVEAYREAIRLTDGSAEVYNNLATTLVDVGAMEESVEAYREALKRRPDWPEGHSNLIFTMGYLPQFNAEDQQAERRRWWERHGAPRFRPVTHTNDRNPERRLRVGYVSGDFRHHAAGYVLAPILFEHDPAVIETVCYSTSSLEDDMTERFRAKAAEWRMVLGVPDDVLADRIREDRIDILVDVSGHTSGNRLLTFARKPAPVQVHAWGQLGGTGLKTMDYMLADPVLIPAEDRARFAETVIDLPCWIAFMPPDPSMAQPVAPTPALAGGGITFGSFNRLAKVTPEVVSLWAEVLMAVPDANLLMKAPQLGDQSNQDRMAKAFGQYGISKDRLRFLGNTARRDHLAAYGKIDVQLDPFPQAGGVTSLEGLWMGVPAVTLPLSTPASRATAAIQASIGLEHFNARDRADYVRIATRLAADIPALAQLRAGLRARFESHPVGNPAAYARAVEATYRQLWRTWCASA